MHKRLALVSVVLGFALVACESTDPAEALPPEGEVGEELPIGDIDDLKEDGDWSFAVECKPIPDLPALSDPMITVSLDGLTLHLVDRAGTYDRTFPIGPGAIKNGVSLTPVSTEKTTGLFYTRTDLPATQDGRTASQDRWSWNESCAIWWTSETGQRIPVFAGLPFIRLDGPSTAGYGIHGPIDSYTLPSGGMLRRGFVSHGCIRMAAADVVEVYARIRGKKTPVRVQQAVERTTDGAAVDVPDRWLLSECRVDADCNFPGGICKQNAYSGRGFCTKACTMYCPDKGGYPTSYCVGDPSAAGQGICVYQPTPYANGCRRFDSFREQANVPRFGQATTKKSACLPGSDGWVGDRCREDADCLYTDACVPVDGGPAGVCGEPCTRYCPDKTGGYASTFCVASPEGSGGLCTSRCTTNDDCALGTTCEAEPRFGDPATVKKACIPY